MRISDWSSDVCSSDLAAITGHSLFGDSRIDLTRSTSFAVSITRLLPSLALAWNVLVVVVARMMAAAPGGTPKPRSIAGWPTRKSTLRCFRRAAPDQTNVITAENRAPWCPSESCPRTSLCLIPVPTATKPANALALHDQAHMSCQRPRAALAQPPARCDRDEVRPGRRQRKQVARGHALTVTGRCRYRSRPRLPSH